MVAGDGTGVTSLFARKRFQDKIFHAVSGISAKVSDRTFNPGKFNPNLSWPHYRTLLRVENPEARAFYEIGNSLAF